MAVTHPRPLTQAAVPVQTGVRWREVALFSLLAYGLTWAWLGVKLVPHLGTLLTATATPTDSTAIVGDQGWLGLAMLGPAIAAGVMRLAVSKEGLRGSLGLLRSWRFYLIALLAPIIVLGGIALVTNATGLAPFTWVRRTPLWLALVAFPINVAVLGPTIGLGEEYGWRGYQLPRLLPLGEVKAAVVVGAIWALWHVPVLLTGYSLPGQHPWLAILVFAGSALAMSLAFTRFYVVTGGSVLLVALMHMSANVYGGALLEEAIPTAHPLLFQAAGLVSSACVVLVMVAVYAVARPAPPANLARAIRPHLDGTWRDWLR